MKQIYKTETSVAKISIAFSPFYFHMYLHILLKIYENPVNKTMPVWIVNWYVLCTKNIYRNPLFIQYEARITNEFH